MTIFNLYSKKQKKLNGETTDVFTYDNIPNKLRVQIIHLIRDVIGIDPNEYTHRAKNAYKFIHQALCREYGLFSLGKKYQSDEDHIFNYFLQTDNIESTLDIIELCFKYISKIIEPDFQNYKNSTIVEMNPSDAIIELNARFKEHAIGFQFESSEIIKIDSTYIHKEIIKPTLSLLNNKNFSGANEEYLKAHEHYRHGRNKECLTECLKSFESTMKIICTKKKWAFKETDTAKKLIQLCFDKGLVPSFTQNQFTSLKSLLESGIPTIRNKLGGHGQGQIPQEVDDTMTRYGLNLTGTNIIFLIEQSNI